MTVGVARAYGQSDLFKGPVWTTIITTAGAWGVIRRLGLGASYDCRPCNVVCLLAALQVVFNKCECCCRNMQAFSWWRLTNCAPNELPWRWCHHCTNSFRWGCLRCCNTQRPFLHYYLFSTRGTVRPQVTSDRPCKCQVHIRRLWQPPQHNLGDGPLWREHGIPLTKEGKPWDVIDTARFAAYASIGWTVAEPAPRLFAALGW